MIRDLNGQPDVQDAIREECAWLQRHVGGHPSQSAEEEILLVLWPPMVALDFFQLQPVRAALDSLLLREHTHPMAAVSRSRVLAIEEMLLAKNKAYGNSAIEPVRVFSTASSREQILVRLDDKVSRLVRGSAAGEDVIGDMIGYLILLRVCDRIARLPARAASRDVCDHRRISPS